MSILGMVACGAIGLAMCPAPAPAASPKSEVCIQIEAICQPPSFLEGAGTFTASGGVEAAGEAAVSVWLAGGTGHVELRLDSQDGGILISAHTTFENPDPYSMHAEGPWVILEATGAYANLHGAGWAVIDGSFVTKEFTYVLDGFVVSP